MTLQIKVKNGNSLTIQSSSNLRIAIVAAILAWVLKQELVLDNGDIFDHFGASVALDGNRALVGADGRDGAKGAAYIYDLSGGNWTQTTELLASNGSAGDGFGNSVALDGNRAIVGSSGRDGPGGISQGAAYIYDLSGTTWVQTTDISLVDGNANDRFGNSVALDGNRALVGAYGRDGGLNGKGVAYIYDLSGTTWSQTTDISLVDGSAGDYFGFSVALDGDRALVGAYGHDGGLNGKGAAYIYDLSGTTWVQTTDISLVDSSAGDYFGWSVALDGNRALVGAYGRDSDKGAAYIYDLSGTTWVQTTDISLVDGSANDRFGYSVALNGNRAIVGASGRDGPGGNQGAAYIYDLSGTTWVQTTELLASNGSDGDGFGNSVALNGNRALVGAWDRDGSRGAAYIYDYERTN